MNRLFMNPRLVSNIIVVFLILVYDVPTVHGFAAWLKCYYDLDESEVIMNYRVKGVEEAPYPVQIEVRKEGQQQGQGQKQQDGGEWTTHNVTYAANTPTTLSVRLKVPEELSRQDVQYVIETTGAEKSGAIFTFPSMCDGRRSHARRHDEAVTLQITGTEESTLLWAGWATGHSPVSLTPSLTLTREGLDEEL